jgi:hypothetical protein
MGSGGAEGLWTHHVLRYRQVRSNIRDTNRLTGSLLNIAEGALGESSNILTRQAELAEQAANGTFSREQRKSLGEEANALVAEYNRILASTEFNDRNLFDRSEGAIPAPARRSYLRMTFLFIQERGYFGSESTRSRSEIALSY